MDQHPENPKHQQSSRPFRLTARGRSFAVVVVLAVAAGTLGTGVYLNRESPTWQRILGTEPVIERVPQATDELPGLLEAVDYTLEFPKTTTSTKTTEALKSTRAMLQEHVELLTPGALAAMASAAARETTGPDAPPAAIPPLSPDEISWRLAQTGTGLLEQALAAPEQESRRLAGSGIELALQARTVLQATGAAQKKIDSLPSPATMPADESGTSDPADSDTPETNATPPATSPEPTAQDAVDTSKAPTGLPEFAFASCPALAPGDTAPGDGAGSESESRDTPSPDSPQGAAGSPDSGQLLGEVIDAAYRLGYAYDVAGARTNAGLRSAAWDRSGVLVDFAESLEGQLDGSLDCAPLRQPAYQLPADAVENPMDSARSGEGQLALLLRDAAAAQTGNARKYLFTAAWDHGFHTQQVTGNVPDFTQVAEVQQEPGSTTGPTGAPGS